VEVACEAWRRSSVVEAAARRPLVERFAREMWGRERDLPERETCRGGREICERDAGEGEELAAAGAVRMTG